MEVINLNRIEGSNNRTTINNYRFSISALCPKKYSKRMNSQGERVAFRTLSVVQARNIWRITPRLLTMRPSWRSKRLMSRASTINGQWFSSTDLLTNRRTMKPMKTSSHLNHVQIWPWHQSNEQYPIELTLAMEPPQKAGKPQMASNVKDLLSLSPKVREESMRWVCHRSSCIRLHLSQQVVNRWEPRTSPLKARL